MSSEESSRMRDYFKNIEKEVQKSYSICVDARKKGFDPEDSVAIQLAKNMAERVEGLISIVEPDIKGSGISKRINQLEKKYGKLSWKVAFVIALETAQEKFCKFENKLKSMEVGIRVGLAYLTLGVVASPLEGFVELKLKKRRDNGEEYFCLMFSGPIRSAGGTAGAVSVLVADYVRKKMGYAVYDASEKEVKRSSTELYDYHERITNLQYLPSEEEIEFYAQNMPIQVDGDASEKREVSNYKDIPRIETNIIRNGFCLVMGECLCQKAPKIWKQLSDWGAEFEMEQWNFLGEFVKLQKSKKAKSSADSTGAKIQPDYTFIKDLVAGRPILGFPMRNGAFRLRYGRSRNSGYSSAAMHPALTYLLDKYIAIGTQLKLERPGKAASMSICDSIEGPLVKLEDGSVLRVNDVSLAKRIAKQVKEIIYLGDILINYGDFFNRAHQLVPAGYCEEWWINEFNKSVDEQFKGELIKVSEITQINIDRLNQIIKERYDSTINGEEALILSEKLSLPLHPKFTYYWNSLNWNEVKYLFDWLAKSRVIDNGKVVEKIVAEYDDKGKRHLEIFGVPHTSVGKEYVVVEDDDAIVLSKFIATWLEKGNIEINEGEDKQVIELIKDIFPYKLRDKGGTFIGARMGRPEKAKVRKLDGQPHCLFPVGEEGGRLRCFQSSMEAGKVNSDFPVFECKCGNKTVLGVCEKCGSKTNKKYFCDICGEVSDVDCKRHGKNKKYKKQDIDIRALFSDVKKQLGLDIYPDLIKGVRGTSNRDHVPEHIAKGILRAKNNVPVNKDGTTRYDMTQLAITHFKPFEIGTTVEKLKELGYEKDIYGKELGDAEQVLELMPQDLILPNCEDAKEEGADQILSRVASFIDELLSRLYKLAPYYNIKSKSDLVGQLVVALAPHTSAGIVGRIVGFSKTQGFYAHPMFHAATRRDCDGDEACVTLLVDAFLNFSKQYLPNSRGSTQDAPLVLTSKLIPSEVDDMLFDIDVVSEYTLEFYEAAMEYKGPWEIKVDQIGGRLNTELQYEGMLFTHDVSDINLGVKCSAYKLLPSMQEKLHGQMDIALKIRAVDEAEVAKIVIEKHFLRDIKGNLRKFSQQQFRCVSCNDKYRRPPLIGRCTNCGGKIVFTISEGSIVKYLEPALSLAEFYNLPDYLKQSLEITKNRVEAIFGKDKEKQIGLGKWFG
jgi:DNA polymerase II large subunit